MILSMTAILDMTPITMSPLTLAMVIGGGGTVLIPPHGLTTPGLIPGMTPGIIPIIAGTDGGDHIAVTTLAGGILGSIMIHSSTVATMIHTGITHITVATMEATTEGIMIITPTTAIEATVNMPHTDVQP